MDEPTILPSDASVPDAETQACASCASAIDGWKRAQADYQNLQKEVMRERANMYDVCMERVWSNLLPVMDQLALALAHVPQMPSLEPEDREQREQWVRGMRAVLVGWERLCTQTGLERIATDGAFDPRCHEAAGEERTESTATGQIVRTLQEGWRIGNKVVRPARVILAAPQVASTTELM